MKSIRGARAILLVATTALAAQVAMAHHSRAQSPNMGPGMMGPGTSSGMGPGTMGPGGYGMGYGMMGPGMYGGMGYGMMGPGMPGGMGYGMMGPDMPGGMGYGMMGPGMYGGMGYGMMGPGMYGGMGPGTMGYGIDGRLEYLKAQLGITDTQKAAWEGYVKGVQSRFDAMQAMHNAMYTAMRTGTPAARLDARIRGMEAMLMSLKEQKPALEALYKILSDDQKKKANHLLGAGWGVM